MSVTKNAIIIEKSWEAEAPAGSLIVVEQNGDDTEVFRWYLNSAKEPRFKKIFETKKYKASQIGALFVFDDHALVHINEEKVDVIYFKAYRGKEVPANYIVNQSIDGKVKHMALGVHRGLTTELYLVIETAGSLQIYNEKIVVDLENFSSTAARDVGKVIDLLKSQYLDTVKNVVYINELIVADQLLILVCAKCNNNHGELSIYER